MNIPNNTEEWRDVKSYEGSYMVSDTGRVKSLDRVTYDKNNRKINRKSKVISSYVDSTGYSAVRFHSDKGSKTCRVHQLVAESFLNHEKCGHKRVVDHIDNNPLNNNLCNIQLISHRENCSKDKKRKGNYIGVNCVGNRWRAVIFIDGIRNHLGYFSTEEEAKDSYNNKLKEINHAY